MHRFQLPFIKNIQFQFKKMTNLKGKFEEFFIFEWSEESIGYTKMCFFIFGKLFEIFLLREVIVFSYGYTAYQRTGSI